MPDFIASAPVASLVLATFVGASLLGLYAAPWMIERGVFRPYWLLPRREWATPVTSAFLHADLGLFNGFTFWAFGFSLEHTMGVPRERTLVLGNSQEVAANTSTQPLRLDFQRADRFDLLLRTAGHRALLSCDSA
jgi:membrane associated rhomboid family serine protease